MTDFNPISGKIKRTYVQPKLRGPRKCWDCGAVVSGPIPLKAHQQAKQHGEFKLGRHIKITADAVLDAVS